MSEPRDRILACACDLYLADGLDGFSMRKLAKEVGVTAPAIYRHYEGRDAVLADVLREAHRTFGRYLYQTLGAPTAAERFFGGGEGYLSFALEHPRLYEIIHTAPEHLGIDVLPPDIETMKASIRQFWNDRVRECMQDGILKEGDPEEVSVTMWSHAYGMVQLYHDGHLPVSPEDFRVLFKASGFRLMQGMATEDFAAKVSTLMCQEAQPQSLG